MRTNLSAQSYVEHRKQWLDESSASALLALLLGCMEFEQRSVKLFGRSIPQPRLIAWCGPVAYTYSGLTLPPKQVPDCLQGVLTRVRHAAATEFNHLLLNLYRNGSDSMGYHADNEPELGPAPVVATLSLGASRRFTLRARRGQQSLTLEMAHGDLVIMAGRCQEEFVHAIPKQPRLLEPRLSITFRRVGAPHSKAKT